MAKTSKAGTAAPTASPTAAAPTTPVDIIEQDELAASSYGFFFVVRRWQALALPHAPTWKTVRLHSTTSRSSIPDTSGIYTILLKPGIADHPACSHLMYVGQSVKLKKRFGKYLTTERHTNIRPKVYRLLNKYPDHLWFCFAEVPEADIDNFEAALIAAYLPPMNDQFPAHVSKVVGAFQ